MVKYKLDLQPDPEVVVVGISSHVKDHRLCWSINRSLGLALTRRRVPLSEDQGGRTLTYMAYDHVDQDGAARYTLVNNHGADGCLLKEQRQTDYFLVVDRELAQQHPDLLDRLRATDHILTAFLLPYEGLKEGYKLLL
ncbi:MAG: IPExxxVDY family protein [Flavobacteriales bacterium]